MSSSTQENNNDTITKEEQQSQEEEEEAVEMIPIPLKNTAAYLMEDYDFSMKGILNNISKRAFYDREKSIGETTQPLPKILQQDPTRVEQLLEEGAKWMEVKQVEGVAVQRLADVPYASESPMQSLDIYFPRDDDNGESEDPANDQEKRNQQAASSSAADSPKDKQENATEKRLVYIHIHGGGWSRGTKDSVFYGGPAMCQNATAATGCISVAVGYRLGAYPGFLHDAAKAIQWVQQNIESLGGDIDNVFLSGHSAGGHICSLLILRHNTFLEPLGVPMSFFKGLVLVSGVYDLFRPMSVNVLDAKNKWFAMAYVRPAFGSDTKLRREASPLLLLDPEKDTSKMGTAMRKMTAKLPSLSLKNQFPRLSQKKLMRLISDDCDDDQDEEETQPLVWKEEDNSSPPPTLILNAQIDMGLQENGQLMAEAMSQYTTVRYRVIEGSDHASICWHETTSRVVADFVQSRGQSLRSVAHANPPKKRRGKRDKVWPKAQATSSCQ